MSSPNPLTPDAFWQQYAHTPYELINGGPVRIPNKEYLHEIISARVLMFLEVHAEEHYLGVALGQAARFRLGPHDLRAVDVAFLTHDKLAQRADPDAYMPFAPDLMAEVVSSRYTTTQIQAKADFFIQAGTTLVWVIDPQAKSVAVFYPNGDVESLSGTDRLSGHHIVPQFDVAVDDLFPPLETRPQ